MNTSREPVKVLVVDDSAHNRRLLTELLESLPDVKVVGTAADGNEGLRQVMALHPDVVTLDLEMPRLGGYSFLRLLKSTAPTPVIVISSYAHKTDVFKALELGAFDFIAKPAKPTTEVLEKLRRELQEKVLAARLVRPETKPVRRPKMLQLDPSFVVGVGASTGGPPAVQRLLEALSPEPSMSLLVCQHMPKQFTRAFAERLDRLGPFSVREAQEGDLLAPGHVFIAPGGRQLVVYRQNGQYLLGTPPPTMQDKHAPSVDRLFMSLAEVFGSKAIGVVLTGMGSDGALGAKAIQKAGGEVWAESEETAVIYGMPQEAVATGAVTRVLPLGEIGPSLVEMARKRK
ncbi:chemotaxis response regulator protein-glutamate methylesterase [Vitiosangium sp. GDMCC 1.1324]|uniref:protein-glutamate methylesterase/protein-glutamine glutaminase n=1 Tax=Vitiosangium sp. (strain GDMCC 1.1324) TaxID=2138576 RepID=UPI000D39BF43|nr:chemotaxis response regulator protein-glutamate methylesterase [Vitiosangium sp. GDMCC 1.1324]PTL82387.1 chemotaxis response regulator protein-glutamate methylesterase [Vitiosangium sp. GDMCC 1.1324]